MVFILMAGCTTTTRTTDVYVHGSRNFLPLADEPVAIPSAEAVPSDPLFTRPTRDLNGPAVLLDGEPTLAMPIHIERPGLDPTHSPCGGAVFVVAPDAPDPRRHSDVFAYADTRTLIDDTGASWVTDRYMDPADPDNRTRMVWVQNIGGLRGHREDRGEECPISGEHNAILFVRGIEIGAVYYSAAVRPAEPI